MTRKEKLVQGVGVNDASYRVTISSRILGKTKVLWTCPVYQVWKCMIARCYSEKRHARHPSYVGCEVMPAWHSFAEFRSWMLSQDWEGMHLDKDILIPGNKIYGAETCRFVSAQVNLFITDRGSERGEFPIGVYWNTGAGKFMAQCGNPFTGKRENLGYYTNQAEAHEAWRQRKHQHACRYANMQTDPRIAQALRTRYAKEAAQ